MKSKQIARSVKGKATRSSSPSKEVLKILNVWDNEENISVHSLLC